MSSRMLLEPPLMFSRQRGSSGYDSTRVRPVTIILWPVCSLCVYTVYLWTSRTLFQEVFKSYIRCFPFSGDVFCVDKKVLADILHTGRKNGFTRVAKLKLIYCKCHICSGSIRVLDFKIKMIYQLETIIAKSNNKISAHNKKWGKYKVQ